MAIGIQGSPNASIYKENPSTTKTGNFAGFKCREVSQLRNILPKITFQDTLTSMYNTAMRVVDFFLKNQQPLKTLEESDTQAQTTPEESNPQDNQSDNSKSKKSKSKKRSERRKKNQQQNHTVQREPSDPVGPSAINAREAAVQVKLKATVQDDKQYNKWQLVVKSKNTPKDKPRDTQLSTTATITFHATNQELQNQAFILINTKPQQAILLFEDLLKNNPEFKYIDNRIGLIRAKLRLPENQTNHSNFESLKQELLDLNKNPKLTIINNIDIQLSLVSICKKLNNNQEAIKILLPLKTQIRKSIDRVPLLKKYIEICDFLGQAYNNLKKYDEALVTFQDAKKQLDILKTNNGITIKNLFKIKANLYKNLSYTYTKFKNFHDPLKLLAELNNDIDDNPQEYHDLKDIISINTDLAITYNNLKTYDKTIKILTKIKDNSMPYIKQNPNLNVKFSTLLSQAYFASGDSNNAINTLKDTRNDYHTNKASSYPEIDILLSHFWIETQQYDNANELLTDTIKKLAKTDAKYITIKIFLCKIKIYKDELDNALKIIQELRCKIPLEETPTGNVEIDITFLKILIAQRKFPIAEKLVQNCIMNTNAYRATVFINLWLQMSLDLPDLDKFNTIYNHYFNSESQTIKPDHKSFALNTQRHYSKFITYICENKKDIAEDKSIVNQKADYIIDLCKEATKKYPYCHEFYYLLAYLHKTMGNQDEYSAAMEKAYSINHSKSKKYMPNSSHNKFEQEACQIIESLKAPQPHKS